MTTATAPTGTMLPPSALRPNDYNPNSMTEAEFAELVAEVRHLGRLPKPVIARSSGDGYAIVDGEHSWRAAREAGLAEIPVEVVDADDFEAMRQTYKRNQHGTHNPVLLGRMFRRMLEGRGISQRELADEIAVSEGTIRNALAYANAADLRNSYAPGGEAEIARLSIRQVRSYLGMPPKIGEAWLKAGANAEHYQSALTARAPVGKDGRELEMLFEPQTLDTLVALGLDGGITPRAFVGSVQRALWLWSYYENYRRYVADLLPYLRPLARLGLPPRLANTIPVVRAEGANPPFVVQVPAERWTALLENCAARNAGEVEAVAMVKAGVRLALRDAGVDLEDVGDPRVAELLAEVDEAPDFIRDSALSVWDKARIHRFAAEVPEEVLTAVKRRACELLEQRDRVLGGTADFMVGIPAPDAESLKGRWSGVTWQSAIEAALAEVTRDREIAAVNALFGDRDRLTTALVEALAKYHAIREQQIGEVAALEVLRSRLDAVPWPELRLLAGYVLDGVAKTAAPGLWLHAARQEGRAEG